MDHKHSLVPCRMNHLEVVLIQKHSVDFCVMISLLDLRSNLEFLSPSVSSRTNLSKNKISKFLKNMRIEHLNLIKGVVSSCYQSVSLEKDALVDHKPMRNTCYRLPSRKVKKGEGRSEKDKRTIVNKTEIRRKKSKFEGKVATV